jgi:hypothetical protein
VFKLLLKFEFLMICKHGNFLVCGWVISGRRMRVCVFACFKKDIGCILQQIYKFLKDFDLYFKNIKIYF